MKILNYSAELSPSAQTLRALNFERPTWLVTCVLNRRDLFGRVSSEAAYEVAARDEDEARNSVRDFVLQSRPGSRIESLRAQRHPRQEASPS